MKSKLLYVASFLLLISISFTFHVTESASYVEWMWTDKVEVPIILLFSSVVCVVVSHFVDPEDGSVVS